jgi:hypothetical protein
MNTGPVPNKTGLCVVCAGLFPKILHSNSAHSWNLIFVIILKYLKTLYRPPKIISVKSDERNGKKRKPVVEVVS